MMWRRHSLSCRRVRRLMHGFLDGEIPAEQAERVAAHLDECVACGIEAEVLRDVVRAIGRQRPDLDPAAIVRLQAHVDRVVGGMP